MSEMPHNNWDRFLREPNNGMHFHPGFIINVCIIYLRGEIILTNEVLGH